jgi:hypothetical protein
MYNWESLRRGVTLEPPNDAHRVYLLAEGGLVRYLVSVDGDRPKRDFGMPLIPEFPEEFDTDLQYIHLVAGAQDVQLHVYYYSSA